ncbi:hypothetical protein PN488_09980 [Nodularia spumigena CS-591/12]|uniref:hypothetical protein n=1 Tax=Nodularia spumigena TaxID=70799 RepID=UPI00232C4CB8|nr:hypothetical protein [Nodularia spumigena]MDB9304701.1 hypothetical protein [Nodularia spumigena CS-591/12]
MDTQPLFWFAGILLSLLASESLSAQALTTGEKKVDTLNSINIISQDNETKKQSELTKKAFKEKHITPFNPEIITFIGFSPKQTSFNAEINRSQDSAYKLREKLLNKNSSCQKHSQNNSPPIPVTKEDNTDTQQYIQPEFSDCEEDSISLRLSNYNNSQIFNESSKLKLNLKDSANLQVEKLDSEPSFSAQLLIAQETNNQSQIPLTPLQPNLPIVPDELPSLPIPEDTPEDKPVLTPEDTPEDKPVLTPEENQKLLRTLIRSLLENSASRYPFLVNTSDTLIINPRNFRPLKFDFYSNFNFDLDKFEPSSRSQPEQFSDPLLKSANISFYPDDDQFYWVLDGNRVVISTEGKHFNLGYQGRSTQENSRQVAKVSTVFGGMQTVFGILNIFGDLVADKKLEDLNIISAAAEIVLPPGATLADNANFTINVTQQDGSLFKKFIPIDDTRKATTGTLLGGGSFFDNLDATNAPKFLQVFPTINLQPLLNNGVKLEIGTIIPPENLTAAGLTFGDFFTKEGFQFNSPISSLPGIKNLRINQTDNDDIVAILSNPFLTKEERDFHYLNSLQWYNFGQQSPEVTTSRTSDNQDWKRYTFSWSHNRTLLEYDPENIKLSYLNVFSNPGLSITTAQLTNADFNQTINASLGLMMGSVFNSINPGNLNETIGEAKEKYNNLQPLATLNTKATSQQRRQMNERLNSTLNYGNSNSKLAQVSGSYTFAGNVTPESSLLLQMRTGIYQRSVQFIQQDIQDWTPETPVVIDFARPSDLGPIFFTGVNIPTNATQINAPQTIEVSFLRAETSDGEVLIDQSYVFDNNLASLFTAVPILGAGKTYDIDFGRIKLSKFRQRDISTSSYVGHLYLPSIEFVMTGSVNNLSYALSTGMWFNLSPDSAPLVNNNLGNLNANATTESFMGGMLKFSAKADFNNIFYDDNKRWNTIISNAPFVSLDYNTNPNRLNLSNISIGNVFQFVKPDFNVVFYPILTYYPKLLNSGVNSNSVGDISAFFLLSFSHKVGLNFNSSVSLGNQAFYKVETTYDVIRNKNFGTLKVGPYYSNHSSATRGFESQFEDPNYGLVFGYESANSGLLLNSRLGNSEYGLRGELNLEFKF